MNVSSRLADLTKKYLVAQQLIIPKFLGIRADGVPPANEEIQGVLFYFWGSGPEGKDVMSANKPVLVGIIRGLAVQDGISAGDSDLEEAATEVSSFVWENFINAVEKTQAFERARQTAKSDVFKAMLELTVRHLMQKRLMNPKPLGAYGAVDLLPRSALVGVAFYTWVNTTRNTSVVSANKPLLLDIISELSSESGIATSPSDKEAIISTLHSMVCSAFSKAMSHIMT